MPNTTVRAAGEAMPAAKPPTVSRRAVLAGAAVTMLAGTTAYASTTAAGPIEAALTEWQRRNRWLNDNTGERGITDAEIDWLDEPLWAPEVDEVPSDTREAAALVILLVEVLVQERGDTDILLANAYATLGLSTKGA